MIVYVNRLKDNLNRISRITVIHTVISVKCHTLRLQQMVQNKRNTDTTSAKTSILSSKNWIKTHTGTKTHKNTHTNTQKHKNRHKHKNTHKHKKHTKTQKTQTHTHTQTPHSNPHNKTLSNFGQVSITWRISQTKPVHVTPH